MKANNKDTMKTLLVVTLWFGLLVLTLLLGMVVLSDLKPLPACTSPLISDGCYRTELTFWGSNEIRTSCEGAHDYEIIKSQDWTDCKPIYEKKYK